MVFFGIDRVFFVTANKYLGSGFRTVNVSPPKIASPKKWRIENSSNSRSVIFCGLFVQIPKEKPKPKEFYSVQLGAFITEISTSEFSKAENVYHIINEEEIYVYLSGEFNELNDAVIEKYKLSKKGQRSIYVVKVIDRRKVVIVE